MSQEEEGAVHRKRAEARRKATVRKLQWTLAAVLAVALLVLFLFRDSRNHPSVSGTAGSGATAPEIPERLKRAYLNDPAVIVQVAEQEG